MDRGRARGVKLHAERRPDGSGERYWEAEPELGWGDLVRVEAEPAGEGVTWGPSGPCSLERRPRDGLVGEMLRLKLWESTTTVRKPRVHWEGGSLSGVGFGVQVDEKAGVSRDGGLPRDRGPGCRSEGGLGEAPGEVGEARPEARAVAAEPTNEGLRVRTWALSKPAEVGLTRVEGGRLQGPEVIVGPRIRPEDEGLTLGVAVRARPGLAPRVPRWLCSWSKARSSSRWVRASFCWMAIRRRELSVFFSSSAAASCLCISSSWVMYSSHLEVRVTQGADGRRLRSRLLVNQPANRLNSSPPDIGSIWGVKFR